MHTPAVGYGNDTSKKASEKPQCRRGSVLPGALWGGGDAGGLRLSEGMCIKGPGLLGETHSPKVWEAC